MVLLASTKNDNENVVSARGPTPPILKCYFSAGYNFQGGVGPLTDTTFSLLDGRIYHPALK